MDTGPAPDEPDVRFETHPAGLRVRVSGENSLAATIAYWMAVLREIESRPRPVLLIDELEGPPLAAAEWEQLVDSMAGSALQGVRLAHVKPRGLDALEFCELHAKDAGFDARVFVSEAEAVRWLRYGETEPFAPRDAEHAGDGYFSTKARSNT